MFPHVPNKFPTSSHLFLLLVTNDRLENVIQGCYNRDMKKKWYGCFVIGLILIFGLTSWGLSTAHQHAQQSLAVQEKTDRRLDAFDKSVQNFKSSIDVMWSGYKKEGGSDQPSKWTHNVTLMQKQAAKVQSEYMHCQKIKNMNSDQKSRFRRITGKMQHQIARLSEN